MANAADGTPLLSTRCRVPDRRLWFGRAELYEDRIRIRGWTWRGRYRRVVPLDQVERVQWWATTGDVNFMLYLDDGRAVPLRLLRGAGTWNAKLHALLGQSLLAHPTPPGVETDAAPL